MSAIDDLNSAVSTLTTSVSAEIAALTAALKNNDSAGIEAAVANINALNTELQASLPAAVTPAS